MEFRYLIAGLIIAWRRSSLLHKLPEKISERKEFI